MLHIPFYQQPLSLKINEMKMSTIFPAMNATLIYKITKSNKARIAK
jgi:hypothetical protein